MAARPEVVDGGLDVRVDLPPETAVLDFVPRPVTGFQVKRTDIQPAAIASEMRPGGALRTSTRELASVQGAYVIVSSRGSTAHKPLRRRLDAMRAAIADLPDPPAVHLDFYDRERLTTR